MSFLPRVKVDFSRGEEMLQSNQPGKLRDRRGRAEFFPGEQDIFPFIPPQEIQVGPVYQPAKTSLLVLSNIQSDECDLNPFYSLTKKSLFFFSFKMIVLGVKNSMFLSYMIPILLLHVIKYPIGKREGDPKGNLTSK